jgi:hypothetical protein
MGTATATDTCTGDADTITGGTGAVVTTSIVTTDKASLGSLIVIPIARTIKRIAAARTGRAHMARPVQPPPDADGSAESHLHRDPDQIRMILGAELLLEQRGGVGHRLVGNLQRIGDFDDLVATAQ